MSIYLYLFVYYDIGKNIYKLKYNTGYKISAYFEIISKKSVNKEIRRDSWAYHRKKERKNTGDIIWILIEKCWCNGNTKRTLGVFKERCLTKVSYVKLIRFKF